MAQTSEEKLMNACRRRDLKTVEEILLKGEINRNCSSKDGWTPLYIAVNGKDGDMVQLLVNHKMNPNLPNKDGLTPLHLAACSRDFRYFRDFVGTMNLKISSRRSIVDILLEGNADVNALDLLNQTPLHLLMKNVNPLVIHDVKNLLKHNIDLSIETKNGETYLLLAIEAGFEKEIWDLLLSKGAKIDKRIYRNGGTLLHIACKNDQTDLIAHILKNQYDIVFEKNVEGEIPLSVAIREENLKATKAIAEHMLTLATREEFTKYEISCKLVLMMLKKQVDYNEIIRMLKVNEDDGIVIIDQLLLLATFTKNHRLELIEELIKRGANINTRNSKGLTPLMNLITYEGSIEDLQFVIMKYKPDLRIKDKEGKNVLHYVARHCQRFDIAFFNFLFNLVAKEKLVEINAEDSEGRSPLYWTNQSSNWKCHVVFLELGLPVPYHDLFHEYTEVSTHINKLFAIGGQVGTILEPFQRNERVYLYIKREVSVLKREIINCCDKTSLYDILFMKRKPWPRIRLMRN